jgi:PD-(D/E)XK nuclease superfamily
MLESQTVENDWRNFFGGARVVLGAIEGANNILKLRLGADFNVFDWIKPNEAMLSDILRDLLDPNGSHGQRSTFLNLALTHLIPTPDPVGADHIERCVVVREALTSHGRLIDLVINFDTCAIGIENKPTAAEQDSQLADYADHLHRQFGGRFCLVFLHGSGMRATSLGMAQKARLQAEKRFLEVPYFAEGGPSLHRWIVLCSAAAQSEKIRAFLTDFADYVAKGFGPNGEIE